MKLLWKNTYASDANTASVTATINDARHPSSVAIEFEINGKAMTLTTVEAKIFRSLLAKENQE